MKKMIDYYKEYKNLYLSLEQVRTILNDPTMIMEFRISDDEQGIPQIKLKLTNTLPEIICDDFKIPKENNKSLLEIIMSDFIECSFKSEMIGSKVAIEHFPGYVETRSQNQKFKFVLGNLKDYEEVASLAINVFQNHNLKVLQKSREKVNIKKLTK